MENFLLENKFATEDQEHFSYMNNDLHYLQQNISSLISPYLFKLESDLKDSLGVDESIEKGLKGLIIEVSKDPEAFIKDDASDGLYIFPENFKSADLPKMLELFRMARNNVVHLSGHFLTTAYKKTDSKKTKGNDALGLSPNIIADFLNKRIFGKPSYPFDDDRVKSWLLILMTIIYVFNNDKVWRRVLSDVDYQLYRYARRWKLKISSFYNALGLDVDWVVKFSDK